MAYTVQTWKDQERITEDIDGLSIDAARHIAQVHAAMGYIGRVVPDIKTEEWEIYLPDGTVRRGPFAEVTLVRI